MDGRSHEPHQDKILIALEKYLAGRFEGDKNKMMSAIEDYREGILSIPNAKPDLYLLEKKKPG